MARLVICTGESGSSSLRRVVLELLRAERAELERLANQDGVSPAVADRTVRDLQVVEADIGA